MLNPEKQQILIDNILELSKDIDPQLKAHILNLIDLNMKQSKQIEKLEKENKFFLKKWDKRNILMNEKDAQKDKIIEQQSRLAAMGEMIDAIAHQWKQPLNALSMMIDLLKSDFEDGEVDKEYIEHLQGDVQYQIEHMISTLNEFRNFLRPSSKNTKFYLYSAISSVLILMKDELISQNIHIYPTLDHEISIFGNANEFKHLFLNLINNSIDAFNERDIHKREIYIRAYIVNNNVIIEVEDNAGGIPKGVIEDIFNPNVTTKQEGKGTGIGLYMSSQIVKKNNGSIDVHNSTNGALFTIKLPFQTN
jgi:signal transduction histidine kinase